MKAGRITATVASAVKRVLSSAVTSLRTSGKVAAGLPYGIGSILNPATARYLSQADKFDPGVLAAHLGRDMPVLVTCSNADIQVTCSEVDNIAYGLGKAGALIDFVHLTGVDHVLKVDSSGTSAHYTDSLPFSPQLATALAGFVSKYLAA